MSPSEYFMESSGETLRLDYKTDPAAVMAQARWAGLHPGMRVADVGCGPGKTSSCLLEAVRPGGSVAGIDVSKERLAYARENYESDELVFHQSNVLGDLSELGQFDFVWCRFLVEYFRTRSKELLANLDRLVRPGGILCLIDLDYNCLSHSGLPDRLEKTIQELVCGLQSSTDFDPFAGRRLYGHLYDMGYAELDARVSAHHLIFGELGQRDQHNWEQKLKMAASLSGECFKHYPDGYEEFAVEFRAFFRDPRRFTYTPLIACRGRKPL